jgi:hypothetical protein
MMPQLITMFGSIDGMLAEIPDGVLLDSDRDLLMSGEVTHADIQDLAGKYPELMGFWVTLATAVGTGIGKIVGAVSKKQKAKRAAKKEKKAAQAAQVEYDKSLKQMRSKNMLVYGGIAVVGLLALWVAAR